MLAGSYRFKVGDELFTLGVGDSIFLPRRVPHAWTQISEKGKMIVVLQAAGKLEKFFVSISALGHEPSSKKIKRIFAENGMQAGGSPLAVD